VTEKQPLPEQDEAFLDPWDAYPGGYRPLGPALLRFPFTGQRGWEVVTRREDDGSAVYGLGWVVRLAGPPTGNERRDYTRRLVASGMSGRDLAALVAVASGALVQVLDEDEAAAG
jgi:hypothetical protein